MAVTKSKKILYKVFKELDLNKLMNYLVEAEKEIDKDKQDNRLSFKIEYDDGTSIDNSSTDVLDETKLIDSAYFSFINMYQDIQIKIVLKRSDGHISVRGKDKNWVDAKYSQLEHLIKVAPDQNKWLANNLSQIVIGNLISMPVVLLIMYFFLVPGIPEITLNIFLGIALNLLISSIAIHRLSGTYQIIEFDTTLEHINKNKQRKNNRKYLLGTYLFPIGLVIFQYFL